MDGLVSTGNKIPDTILNINFANKKNFLIFFIHTLVSGVDNSTPVNSIAA